MKLGAQVRYPRPASILRDIAILRQAVPMDAEPVFEWRTSFNGRPNLRVRAVTNRINWIVDLYCGHYYRVQVEDKLGEVWRSIPALVGYLHRHLRITA